ncbi:MAG: hypothetical protein ABI972_20540 [Acidobacteriota bacterium]
MRLKSYFASTVEEAISLASRELGEDAMLVYSRETMPEARNLGRYEVVFALEADVAGPPENAVDSGTLNGLPAASAVRSAEPVAPWRELRADLLEMKRQFTRMERLMVHTTGAVAANRWSAPVEDLFQELLAQEFPADLAAALVSAVEPRRATSAIGGRDIVVSELAAHLAELRCGRISFGQARAHAFIGPSGGGKTTMLVKLAVLLGMEQRTPVMLVSLDSRRIGGTDQLKTFAQILGVPFTAIDHRSALERLLEIEGHRHILFLDTPGFSEEDLAEQAWLPAVLRANEEVQTHLVLPAYARTKEFARIVRRYEPFRPSSLMLTHMDESETIGGVIGEVLRCGLPVPYCSTGQSIPEDIQVAEPEWLAQRSLPASEGPAAAKSSGATWAAA